MTKDPNSSPSQLDIPDELLEASLDEEVAKALEAAKLTIPQFCDKIMEEVKACPVTPEDVKGGVATLASLVQHLYMSINQFLHSQQAMYDVTKIVLTPQLEPKDSGEIAH